MHRAKIGSATREMMYVGCFIVELVNADVNKALRVTRSIVCDEDRFLCQPLPAISGS